MPLVQKRARAVEEARVGKQLQERTEKVRDTVRKTDVQAEEGTASAATPKRTPAKRDGRPR